MKKKTIVMVGNMSWGMFQFRSDLMKHFLKLGHRVVVIAPHDYCSEKIQALGCEFHHVFVDRKGINPFKDLKYTSELIRTFLTLQPDIVLTYTIKPVLYGNLAAWLAKVPLRIGITTGLGHVFSNDNWVSKVSKFLYKFCLKFASQVWFLNDDDLQTFLTNNLVKKEKTFILPGEGVDVDHFIPSVNFNADLTFTLISRMLWDKGVGLFAQCAEELKETHPHIKFQVVGPIDHGNPEGIPAERLDEWNKKGFLTYLGRIDDIRDILRNTSCLVHPTYYKEGLPRILMEANAMGIPCITTDTTGCRDVIQNGVNGFLVSPKSTESLKNALMEFIDLHDTQKISLGKSARSKIVETFSSIRINRLYEERLSL